ncbi:CCR-like [Raphanus sativus]|uniref:Light-regulated protein 1, chloroplastic n=1 Tax=Raphanus sativus TaxID=3726 RepID=A0A6J0JY93_RAPSA|nr:light-regulated protein 1, chloroplastic [Raphanus sativus]KAJ4888303.1 CCR-like [Raphanus sativus]
MQGALCIKPTIPPLSSSLFSPKISLLLPPQTITNTKGSRLSSLRPNASSSPLTSDPLTVDYDSLLSVFPAEACEVISGYACSADIYPEVKLETKPISPPVTSSENVDREYLEYNTPKTVFVAEACVDLGGEFCEPGYQKDVY